MHTFRPWICLLALSLVVVAQAPAAEPPGRKLEARLLWGTDDAKSPDPSHKPLDGTLAKKIKSMPLKYKNYFEVNRLSFAINDKDYTKVEMSKQCYIEVKKTGESNVEVILYGKGKMVKRVDSSLSKGETVILGGDDKNGTAWLVVVNPLEPPKTK